MPQDTKAADLQFLEGVWTPSISDCTEFLEGLPDDKIDLRGPGSSQMTLIAGGQLTQYVDGEPFSCDFETATARQGSARASLTCHDQGETFDRVELRVHLQGRSGEFKWFNFGDATPITQTLYHCSSISDLSRRFAGHWSFDRQSCSATAPYAEGSVTFRKGASQEMSLILDPARKEDIPQTDFTALVTVDKTPPIQGTASVVEDQITISIGPYQSRAKTIREGFGFSIKKLGGSPPYLYWGEMPLLGSGQAMKFLEECIPEPELTAEPSSSPAASAFEILPNIDLPGGDYRTIKRTTIDVCKATCATQDRCVAFTYNRNADWCFLKEMIGPARAVANATSGVKTETEAQTSPLTIELLPGVDLSGSDYRTIERTTLDVCKATCGTQDRCIAFTYNRQAQSCFLKEAKGEIQFVEFAISGLKEIAAAHQRSDKAVVDGWYAANASCRGELPGDDTETLAWCKVRDAITDILGLRNWCYGREGEFGNQYEWHKCGPGSLRENQPLVTTDFELDGSFISISRGAIPNFPSDVPGFYSAEGEDFWGKPFDERGTLRVFEQGNWVELPDFPSTQNGCSSGRFMVRWRSANPDVIITAGLFFAGEVIEHSESGIQGYMMGSNCHQPRFRFSGKAPGNQATLADVYYEIRFWRAGV